MSGASIVCATAPLKLLKALILLIGALRFEVLTTTPTSVYSNANSTAGGIEYVKAMLVDLHPAHLREV